MPHRFNRQIKHSKFAFDEERIPTFDAGLSNDPKYEGWDDLDDGWHFLTTWDVIKPHFFGGKFQACAWTPQGLVHYGTHHVLSSDDTCHVMVARNKFRWAPSWQDAFGKDEWQTLLSVHYFCPWHHQARHFLTAHKLEKVERNVPAGMKVKILDRDKRTCQACGAKAPEVKLHVDHRMPLSRGGTNDESNLWTLCEECNLGKAAHVFESML